MATPSRQTSSFTNLVFATPTAANKIVAGTRNIWQVATRLSFTAVSVGKARKLACNLKQIVDAQGGEHGRSAELPPAAHPNVNSFLIAFRVQPYDLIAIARVPGRLRQSNPRSRAPLTWRTSVKSILIAVATLS